MIDYLGKGYFHQDYDLDAGTPADLVRMFALEDHLQGVRDFHSQLAEFLACNPTEEQARELWLTEADSNYDPAQDTKSCLDWIREMSNIVGEVLLHRS